MKVKELRAMSSKDLLAKLEELRAELRREYAHIRAGARPENPGKLREIKRTVARILTILRERGEL